jgi:hypothetical protein
LIAAHINKDGGKRSILVEEVREILDMIADATVMADEVEFDTSGISPADRADSIMAVNAGTRTFSIGPKSPATEFVYFAGGKKYTVSTTLSIVFADTEGEHWFYLDEEGLKTEFNPDLTEKSDIILNAAFISTIYWNATATRISPSYRRMSAALSVRAHWQSVLMMRHWRSSTSAAPAPARARS